MIPEGGPVVQAAQNALETGKIELVLFWLKKDYESEIEKAFESALIKSTGKDSC